MADPSIHISPRSDSILCSAVPQELLETTPIPMSQKIRESVGLFMHTPKEGEKVCVPICAKIALLTTLTLVFTIKSSG